MLQIGRFALYTNGSRQKIFNNGRQQTESQQIRSTKKSVDSIRGLGPSEKSIHVWLAIVACLCVCVCTMDISMSNQDKRGLDYKYFFYLDFIYNPPKTIGFISTTTFFPFISDAIMNRDRTFADKYSLFVYLEVAVNTCVIKVY